MTPWEQFQLSHPTAVRLCECANALVRANQPIDTLHLLYAALSPQTPDVEVGVVIAQLLPQTLRERLLAAIVAEWLRPAPTAALRQPSPALAQCIELWRQRAADPTLPVTDVFMVATIVDVDVRVQRMLDLCGIAPQAFVQNLWQISAQVTVQRFSQSGPIPMYVPDPFGPAITAPQPAVRIDVLRATLPPSAGTPAVVPPMPPVWPFGQPAAASRPLRPEDFFGMLSSSLEDAAIRDEIARLVRFVEPSRTPNYAQVHALDVTVYLDLIAETLHDARVPVIAERNGTHSSKLPQILADRFAQSYKFEGKQDTLNAYRGLFRLDIAELRDLASVPGRPDPVKVFEAVLREFAGNCWLLLLDHIELLYVNAKVDESLRVLFLGCGDAPLFGRYYLAGDETPATLGARLGSKVALAFTQPPSGIEAVELIRRFFLPQWQMEGFTFAENAFDGVLALGQYVWMGGQRMFLPYLVTELAQDTIQTVRDGDTSIRAAARRAISVINVLKPRDWLCRRDDSRRQLDRTLLEAMKEIQQLVQKPLPDQVGGQRVLTRAYLTAQLLGGGRAEFRYPG